LKYQFWILLGVALILPFVGWIMGTSGMMSEAAERTKKLTDLRSALKAEGSDPNDTWANELSQINVDQEKQKDIAWRQLYELQKPKMVWPTILTKDRDWPAGDDADKMNNRHMELYRLAYPGKRGEVGEYEKVRQIVKPIVDDDWQTGLINFDASQMPRPDEEWATQAPSPKQIKAAQEDLWLLTAILECIAKVNEGAPNAYDAPIRQIDELLLRGGTKGAGSSAAKAGAASSGPAAGHGMSGMADMMKMRGRFGGEMGGGGGGGVAIDYKINADEELGPERPVADAGTSASTASVSSSAGSGTGGMTDMMKSMSATMMGGGLGGRQGGGTNMERYRDEQKEFKTRGFSLQVVMDHRRIPELLVALSNCEHWPINVLRVHEADYKDEDLVPGDGESPAGGRSMPGMGYGGPRAGHGGPRAGHGASSAGAGMNEMMRAMMKGRGSMPGARPPAMMRGGEEGGEGFSAARSALDDPNLANVAIVGLIYIFNKPPDPPPVPAATQPAGTTQPVAGTTPAAGAPVTPAESAATGADAVDKSDSAGAADETSDDKSNEKTEDSADTKPDSPSDDDARPGKSD
jgi:hypothetical protein